MTRKGTMRSAAILLLTGLTAACGDPGDLEVRTFPLHHLQAYEVEPLIAPYVFTDREDGTGAATTTEGAITVRETAANLDRIEKVLAEYDQPRGDVQLHFQLIEADGFRGEDARIADVEKELRKIFQFAGYRLAGEAFVSATDRSEVSQLLRGTDMQYAIEGRVYRLQGGLIRLEDLFIGPSTGGVMLRTTVNVRPGQTLVLGSSPKEGSTATLLLTVRAEEVSPPPGQ